MAGEVGNIEDEEHAAQVAALAETPVLVLFPASNPWGRSVDVVQKVIVMQVTEKGSWKVHVREFLQQNSSIHVVVRLLQVN